MGMFWPNQLTLSQSDSHCIISNMIEDFDIEIVDRQPHFGICYEHNQFITQISNCGSDDCRLLCPECPLRQADKPTMAATELRQAASQELDICEQIRWQLQILQEKSVSIEERLQELKQKLSNNLISQQIKLSFLIAKTSAPERANSISCVETDPSLMASFMQSLNKCRGFSLDPKPWEQYLKHVYQKVDEIWQELEESFNSQLQKIETLRKLLSLEESQMKQFSQQGGEQMNEDEAVDRYLQQMRESQIEQEIIEGTIDVSLSGRDLIDDKIISSLYQYEDRIQSIRSINLSGNSLTSTGLRMMLDLWGGRMTGLVELNLNDNMLDNESKGILGGAWVPLLRKLNLKNNQQLEITDDFFELMYSKWPEINLELF